MWNIVCYGIIKNSSCFIIQRQSTLDDWWNLCLWTKNKPQEGTLKAIEEFMAEHTEEAYSSTGSYEDIMEELKGIL